MTQLIAPCGLDCAICEARMATLANDDVKRQEVAAKWSKVYGSELAIERINCTGCREEGVKFDSGNHCKFNNCVVERNIGNCSECADYPCGKLVQFFEHVPEAKVNLDQLRK